MQFKIIIWLMSWIMITAVFTSNKVLMVCEVLYQWIFRVLIILIVNYAEVDWTFFIKVIFTFWWYHTYRGWAMWHVTRLNNVFCCIMIDITLTLSILCTLENSFINYGVAGSSNNTSLALRGNRANYLNGSPALRASFQIGNRFILFQKS